MHCKRIKITSKNCQGGRSSSPRSLTKTKREQTLTLKLNRFRDQLTSAGRKKYFLLKIYEKLCLTLTEPVLVHGGYLRLF